jgi:hypothetical protein
MRRRCAEIASEALHSQLTPLTVTLTTARQFDALSRSQSGIVDIGVIDERRGNYEDADGGFDAEAFAADLAAGRGTIAVSLAIFPGTLNLVFLVAFLQADGVSAVLEAWGAASAQVGRNIDLWTGMAGM